MIILVNVGDCSIALLLHGIKVKVTQNTEILVSP